MGFVTTLFGGVATCVLVFIGMYNFVGPFQRWFDQRFLYAWFARSKRGHWTAYREFYQFYDLPSDPSHRPTTDLAMERHQAKVDRLNKKATTRKKAPPAPRQFGADDADEAVPELIPAS